MTGVVYRVRVSSRAKNPRLKFSARDGLVVVIPNGFDEARIPSVVERKRDWIRRSEERLREQTRILVPGRPSSAPPAQISLLAIGQEWSVRYQTTSRVSATAVERLGQRLFVFGDTENRKAVRDALSRWLSRKTRQHIAPWLEALGRERRLDVPDVMIRSQRTRWASCSPTGTISLNLRLMLLPKELVRYALLHELAHTLEMNHGRRYWALLESLEPDYRALDEKLRAGWQMIPDWLRPSRDQPLNSRDLSAAYRD